MRPQSVLKNQMFRYQIIAILLCGLFRRLLASSESEVILKQTSNELLQDCTQVYASHVHRALSSVPHDLEGLVSSGRSHLINSLQSSLVSSFHKRLAQQVADETQSEFAKDNQQFWESVRDGMVSDLNHYWTTEIRSDSGDVSLNKRDIFSKEFKSDLRRNTRRIRWRLRRLYKVIYYKGIKIPFLKLKYLLHIWWLKFKFRWEFFTSLRAYKKQAKMDTVINDKGASEKSLAKTEKKFKTWTQKLIRKYETQAKIIQIQFAIDEFNAKRAYKGFAIKESPSFSEISTSWGKDVGSMFRKIASRHFLII